MNDERRTNKRNRRMGECIDGFCVDGWMDGRTDGQSDRLIYYEHMIGQMKGSLKNTFGSDSNLVAPLFSLLGALGPLFTL